MLPNYHVLEVSHKWSNREQSPMVLIVSRHFRQRVIIHYNINGDGSPPSLQAAINHLTKQGFEIIGRAEGKDCYLVITNTFLPIK